MTSPIDLELVASASAMLVCCLALVISCSRTLKSHWDSLQDFQHDALLALTEPAPEAHSGSLASRRPRGWRDRLKRAAHDVPARRVRHDAARAPAGALGTAAAYVAGLERDPGARQHSHRFRRPGSARRGAGLRAPAPVGESAGVRQTPPPQAVWDDDALFCELGLSGGGASPVSISGEASGGESTSDLRSVAARERLGAMLKRTGFRGSPVIEGERARRIWGSLIKRVELPPGMEGEVEKWLAGRQAAREAGEGGAPGGAACTHAGAAEAPAAGARCAAAVAEGAEHARAASIRASSASRCAGPIAEGNEAAQISGSEFDGATAGHASDSENQRQNGAYTDAGRRSFGSLEARQRAASAGSYLPKAQRTSAPGQAMRRSEAVTSPRSQRPTNEAGGPAVASPLMAHRRNGSAPAFGSEHLIKGEHWLTEDAQVNAGEKCAPIIYSTSYFTLIRMHQQRFAAALLAGAVEYSA